MIGQVLTISLINILVFGGGGIFIPIYQSVYVDLYKLLTTQDYYTLVSLVNIFPGATGGKLASYLMYLDHGLGGAMIGALVFTMIPIIVVILTFKSIDKIKNHPLYLMLNDYLQPIMIGIFIALAISFIKLGFGNLPMIIHIIYLAASLHMIYYHKTNIAVLIIIAIVINSLLFFVLN